MKWGILATLCQLVIFQYRQDSRGRCRLASVYDAEGGPQFRAILQLLRQICSSFQ
jgi:hypothetical protein